MNDFYITETDSAHAAKVLLCFVLEKLNRPIEEKQLYEVAMDSGVVNYFYYTEALDDLLKNGSVSRQEHDGSVYIVLEEKGRWGADYFNDTVPYYFRKQLLTAALRYFAKLRREDEADIEIIPEDNGCKVRCTIKDGKLELMKLDLYAPDDDQAQLIKEKIMLDPTGFYSRIIGYTLGLEEELPEVDDI
ncbi:MAG: DUF4364 family protein [Oscillospiraceae bacterium]|nr:DUF4364 family protein [Oscillospiraceae bacterium]